MRDDLIRRQDAIDAINTWDKFGVDERSRIVRWHEGLEPYVHLRDVLTAIVNLPPAQSTLQPTCNQLATTEGDLISRQVAIDVVTAWLHKALNPLNRSKYNEGEIDAYETALSELKKIPSAQPTIEPRVKGHWIELPDVIGVAYCSECDYQLTENNTNFCPNCGADMREVTE